MNYAHVINVKQDDTSTMLCIAETSIQAIGLAAEFVRQQTRNENPDAADSLTFCLTKYLVNVPCETYHESEDVTQEVVDLYRKRWTI